MLCHLVDHKTVVRREVLDLTSLVHWVLDELCELDFNLKDKVVSGRVVQHVLHKDLKVELSLVVQEQLFLSMCEFLLSCSLHTLLRTLLCFILSAPGSFILFVLCFLRQSAHDASDPLWLQSHFRQCFSESDALLLLRVTLCLCLQRLVHARLFFSPLPLSSFSLFRVWVWVVVDLEARAKRNKMMVVGASLSLSS